MRVPTRPLTVAVAAGLGAAALSLTSASAGWADHGNDNSQGGLTVTTILSGKTLTHTFIPAGGGAPMTEQLSKPDDITQLGNDVYVGFQNGVGPQGQPSGDLNTDSTVVELTTSGTPLAQWDVTGKVDGLTADPGLNALIATVNEDANSSLYTITPGAATPVQNYAYNEPLPHFGGTDAISILGGQILISASAPGTTGGSAPGPYPAVYSVTLSGTTATVTPVFGDEDPAVVANVGSQQGTVVNLALTDPDSSSIVPSDAARFAGDFMLTSQGDLQQIFLHQDGTLSVLNLTQSVDDTAWPEGDGGGTLFATDSTNDTVDAVTGDFSGLPIAVATPCGANSAPSTCPAPGFPANYLATVNPWNGHVDQVDTTGAAFVPQGGLLFVATHPGNQG